MHKFVYDEQQVKKFYNLLPRLKNDEVYFVSMSSRSKYLSSEEKIKFGVTDNMFARELVKRDSFSTFMRVLKSMQVSEGGYTSRSNVLLPNKCIAVYGNISAISGKKALKAFMSEAVDIIFEGNDRRFISMDSKLMSCYQTAYGTKTLIDVDFDIPDAGKYLVLELVNELKGMVDTHIIKTRSGYHVLIERKNIKFNYTKIIKILNDRAVKAFGKGEVVVNKQGLVPIPGTLQGEYEVRFIDEL